MKLKVNFGLFRCGRCRKSYANPLGHSCVIRMDRKAPIGTTKVRPKLSGSVTCDRCGKPFGNPLTHVCTVKSDFKRRKAAHAKAQAAARRKAAAAARPKHLYRQCRDGDCKRLPCVAWKEALEIGLAEGEEAGYAKGYSAGVASCG